MRRRMKKSLKYDTWEWDEELQENTDPGLWRAGDDHRLPRPKIEGEIMIQKWELDIRKIKKSIIRNTSNLPKFKAVYISSDIADEIKRTTLSREAGERTIGEDHTFETVPLKVDPELPIGGIVYVW